MYLPITLLAFALNALALLIDKFLMTKKIQDPLVYLFYFSLFSGLTLFLLPFASVPSVKVFLISSASTLFWIAGAYLMLKVLKFAESSRVIPTIGVFVPVFLFLHSSITGSLKGFELTGVLVLIIGFIFLVLPDITKKSAIEVSVEFPLTISSALFFAISYLFLREAFLNSGFLTVFVYSKLILIPLSVCILLIPYGRRIVLGSGSPKGFFLFSKSGALFLSGQAFGGISQILITFAISLATPALVNSLQGIQYVILFAASLALKKRFPDVFMVSLNSLNLISKTVGIFLIAAGLYVLSLGPQVWTQKTHTQFGVNFSPNLAEYLGLDYQKMYLSILDDLNVKYLRLPTYWEVVEPSTNSFDFSQTDFMLQEAQKREASVLLVVGVKQPRWPECHRPKWVNILSLEERQNRILNLIETVVSRYKDHPAIWGWQVENEPLFEFGDSCDKPDLEFLKREVALVKSLSQKPVILTDSGEWETWISTMSNSDILGISVYSKAYNPVFGYISIRLPAFYYTLKSSFVRKFFAPQNQKTIIAELQAEPWLKSSFTQTPIKEQKTLFRIKDFEDNLTHAKAMGFDEIYLWGAEWWYFMKEQGNPEYWLFAKNQFSID